MLRTQCESAQTQSAALLCFEEEEFAMKARISSRHSTCGPSSAYAKRQSCPGTARVLPKLVADAPCRLVLFRHFSPKMSMSPVPMRAFRGVVPPHVSPSLGTSSRSTRSCIRRHPQQTPRFLGAVLLGRQRHGTPTILSAYSSNPKRTNPLNPVSHLPREDVKPKCTGTVHDRIPLPEQREFTFVTWIVVPVPLGLIHFHFAVRPAFVTHVPETSGST